MIFWENHESTRMGEHSEGGIKIDAQILKWEPVSKQIVKTILHTHIKVYGAFSLDLCTMWHLCTDISIIINCAVCIVIYDDTRVHYNTSNKTP